MHDPPCKESLPSLSSIPVCVVGLPHRRQNEKQIFKMKTNLQTSPWKVQHFPHQSCSIFTNQRLINILKSSILNLVLIGLHPHRGPASPRCQRRWVGECVSCPLRRTCGMPGWHTHTLWKRARRIATISHTQATICSESLPVGCGASSSRPPVELSVKQPQLLATRCFTLVFHRHCEKPVPVCHVLQWLVINHFALLYSSFMDK